MPYKPVHFEVLWYDQQDNPHFVDFKSKVKALNFYEKHKYESDKSNWWITKRDADGNVLEDIVF